MSCLTLDVDQVCDVAALALEPITISDEVLTTETLYSCIHKNIKTKTIYNIESKMVVKINIKLK